MNMLNYDPECGDCVMLAIRPKISTRCLRCRRQYPGQEAGEHKPDLYEAPPAERSDTK